METLESCVEPGVVLASIGRIEEVLRVDYYEPDAPKRIGLSHSSWPVQVAMMGIPSGHSYPPHRHLPIERKAHSNKTQECWIVVMGKIQVTVFDVDKSLHSVHMLESGDVFFAVDGGHAYQNIGPLRAAVIEVKQGEYRGPLVDKELL